METEFCQMKAVWVTTALGVFFLFNFLGLATTAEESATSRPASPEEVQAVLDVLKEKAEGQRFGLFNVGRLECRLTEVFYPKETDSRRVEQRVQEYLEALRASGRSFKPEVEVFNKRFELTNTQQSVVDISYVQSYERFLFTRQVRSVVNSVDVPTEFQDDPATIAASVKRKKSDAYAFDGEKMIDYLVMEEGATNFAEIRPDRREMYRFTNIVTSPGPFKKATPADFSYAEMVTVNGKKILTLRVKTERGPAVNVSQTWKIDITNHCNIISVCLEGITEEQAGRHEQIMEDYRNVDGTWIPYKVTINDVKFENGQEIPIRTSMWQVTNVDLKSPVEDTAFVVSFAPGTKVKDYTLGVPIDYVAGEPFAVGSPELEFEKEVYQEVVAQTERLSSTAQREVMPEGGEGPVPSAVRPEFLLPGEEEGESQGVWTTLVLVFCIFLTAVAVGLLALVAIRRRRSRLNHR